MKKHEMNLDHLLEFLNFLFKEKGMNESQFHKTAIDQLKDSPDDCLKAFISSILNSESESDCHEYIVGIHIGIMLSYVSDLKIFTQLLEQGRKLNKAESL